MNSDPAPASDHDPLKPSEFHGAASESVPQRTVNSADLFQGAREVQIRHDEKIYRLQVTRNGKLILIK
jgi:hemin uptake protein HemP